MAATPEEFLREGILVRPEPPSPSVFLDLPPTPHGDAEDPASFDDMVLPYVSRMLMEEGIDDHFFYEYPDHPALLQVQLPFAQILSSYGSNTTSSSGDGSSGNSNNTLSPSSSSNAWPHDAVELSRPLHSPPYTHKVAPGHDGGSTDIQSRAFFNGAEEDAKTATFPGGNADQGMLSSGSDFFKGLFPGENMEMLNSAFFKGMEEASKFLPRDSSLPINHGASSREPSPTDGKPVRSFTVQREAVDGMLGGGGHGGGRRKNRDKLEAEEGRASKMIMQETEEDGDREMFDEMMLHDHEICMKGVQDLRIAVDNDTEKKSSRKKARRRRGASDSEMVDLHTLLLHCAQAVSTDDRRRASELLKQIKQSSSPRGDAAQRLAHYLAEALEARLAGTGSQLYQSLMVKRTSVVDFLKAYQLFMAACCCKKVAFTFSNKTIYDAVAGRSRLHIVDYGLNYGFQWPGLLRGLAAREGGPPEVRITGIDLPQPGFRPSHYVEETGRRLGNCAQQFGVPFKFHGIAAAKRETVRPEDLNIDRDEVLVVSSLCHFRHLMDENENLAFDSPSPRDQVLENIRKMRPDVFIHGIVNGSYGATYFLTRFREVLFHYAAQFDLLDATVPRDSDERLLVERDMFGRAALNVIACEGADRVERPETYKQWQVRNHRAGLTQLPLKPDVVKVVLDKVRDNYHKDFVVDGDGRWLLHRWKGRVLYALSTWVADDATSMNFHGAMRIEGGY